MTRLPALLVCLAALPSAALTDRSGPYEFEVLVGGAPARTFRHEGETFVLGHLGERYTLRIVNHSGLRVEAVVSVDGRDAIDGKPGDWREKRGYLVPAFGSMDIDGWRLSQREAAAFRFSSVPESYAARTGNAREVGVIGVAIFPERWRPPPRPLSMTPPWPWEGQRRDQQSQGRGAAPEENAPAAPSASPPASERAESAPEGQKKSAERPGLGTEFGESVSSPVSEVAFERARHRPDVVLGARYDDRDGLVAIGIDGDGSGTGEADLRRTAQPFPVSERGYAEPPLGWRR